MRKTFFDGQHGANDLIEPQLFLGIDGGGSHCRARLMDASGQVLGQGNAGPANSRLGLTRVFAEINQAAQAALIDARFPPERISQ